MSAYRRNILVGATVLVALLMLGWMIIAFGGNLGSLLAGESIPVRFKTQRADGLSEGSALIYRGVNVGKVAHVNLDDNQRDVYVEATVDLRYKLPSNLVANIRQTGLLGSASSIYLETTGPAPEGSLKPSQVIDANFVGLELLPASANDLSKEITLLARQWRESNVVGNVNRQLDSIDKLIGDEKTRNELKASVTGFREAIDKINKLADTAQTRFDQLGTTIDKSTTHIDELSKQANTRMDDLGKLLAQANEITTKINNGNGTAGKVLNDPRLYESLAETAAKLNDTVKDIQRLIQQWEQEGVTLKLK